MPAEEARSAVPKQLFVVSESMVQGVDLSGLADKLGWNSGYKHFFGLGAGQEHYKLLASLSEQCSPHSLVVDLGTLYGSSALALASNPLVNVHTYDIVRCIPEEHAASSSLSLPNVTQIIKDGIEGVADFASKTDLIVLDIDPHDGLQERCAVNALLAQGYRGIVVCDDIHLNDAMKGFWEWVPASIRKLDVTPVGHWSGTGILVFDAASVDVKVIPSSSS